MLRYGCCCCSQTLHLICILPVEKKKTKMNSTKEDEVEVEEEEEEILWVSVFSRLDLIHWLMRFDSVHFSLVQWQRTIDVCTARRVHKHTQILIDDNGKNTIHSFRIWIGLCVLSFADFNFFECNHDHEYVRKNAHCSHYNNDLCGHCFRLTSAKEKQKHYSVQSEP